MNYENKFESCQKDKDGFTKIRIRLYGKCEYICVMAKPIPLCGEISTEEDIKEAIRTNLTKFQIKNIPGTESLYGIVDDIAFMYFNGNECAWKFEDDGIEINDKNLSYKKIKELEEEKPWFEPHNDNEGNFGDDNVHAVYKSITDE